MNKGVFQCPSKSGDQNFALGIVAEGGTYATNKDTSVRSYGCFGVRLHLREETEKIVVQNTLVELDAIRKGYNK